MPLYEYRCQECEERFETLQAVGADATGVLCPSCGAEGPERQLSTFAASTGSATATAATGAGALCGPGFR